MIPDNLKLIISVVGIFKGSFCMSDGMVQIYSIHEREWIVFCFVHNVFRYVIGGFRESDMLRQNITK